ncbi:MAG TPA: Hsp20/alpha crystallin family protein [Methylocella sp.]|nr:Hsp20/alpha crystallin family protein [Methylocella sp.]
MAEPSKLPVKTERKGVAPRHWPPFDTFRREVDRLFDNFMGGGWHLPFGRQTFDMDVGWPRDMSLAMIPAVDVAEKEKEYEITVELPGLDEKSIDIKLSNRTLTIRGEKKEEKEEREKDYYLSERRYGSFSRSFEVPDTVDTSKIEASFAKGVLTLKLPKSADAQKSEKNIEIKAA